MQEIIEFKREILRLKLDKFINLGLRMDYHPEIDSDVYIYGAGIIGKKLFSCFEKKPRGFIDRNDKIFEVYETKVYQYEHICNISANNLIVVTPTWDFESIRDLILEKNGKLKVINLEDLVREL